MFDAMSKWNPNYQQPSPLMFGGAQFSAENLQGNYLDPMSMSTGPLGAGSTPFNYETDMAGLMPTATPFASTPTNQGILSSIGYSGNPGGGLGDKLREWGVLGTRDQQGWGGLALGAAQGAAGLYMGMKQYGLMKDQLATQKNQFERQYESQKTLTNARMEDRQRARVNSSPTGAYESVSSYMDRNRVK